MRDLYRSTAKAVAPPVKYTPELGGKISGAVAAGTPFSAACRIAGISRTTFYNWLREYPDFAASMEKAEGQRVQARLEKIEQKSTTDWRADAWILERTSEDFREVKDVRVQVENGVAQVLDAVRPLMSTGAYDELLRALAAATGVARATAELPPGDES